MIQSHQPFSLHEANINLSVTPISFKEHRGFIIRFPDGRQPLVIVRATSADGSNFWTSVPEGRQSEAELIGKEIETYLKENN